MKISDIRIAIRSEIIGKMQQISDGVTAGRPATFEEYKRSIGRLKGLQDALDTVDEVFHKLLDENEGDTN